jgi:hypothetical protein
MLCVFAAIATIFLYSQPIRIILFVLHGCVIASFASTASKRNDHSVVFLSQCPNSLNAFQSALRPGISPRHFLLRFQDAALVWGIRMKVSDPAFGCDTEVPKQNRKK